MRIDDEAQRASLDDLSDVQDLERIRAAFEATLEGLLMLTMPDDEERGHDERPEPTDGAAKSVGRGSA